jgi:hypothetical protein
VVKNDSKIEATALMKEQIQVKELLSASRLSMRIFKETWYVDIFTLIIEVEAWNEQKCIRLSVTPLHYVETRSES